MNDDPTLINRGKGFSTLFEQHLGLPKDASDWLCRLFDAIQFFDDVYDKDDIPDHAFKDALFHILIDMPLNPFFRRYADILSPCVAQAILKWFAANHAEENGRADEKSFVWRAGFYDIVLIVANVCLGREKTIDLSEPILRMYGEQFKNYEKEFKNA